MPPSLAGSWMPIQPEDAVLVVASLFNCPIASSVKTSAYSQLFANHWLCGAILLSAALQAAVVQTHWLNLAFETVPLTLQQWATCLVMGNDILRFSELRK